ncbi:MAG: anti-sigma factor [Pseudomonadota bacterium]
MTAPHDEDEGDLLAAEYSLGLVDGAERADAERLTKIDPAFAEAVERWSSRLAPFAAEAAAIVPDRAVWSRIERSLDAEDGNPGSAEPRRVVVLHRQVRRWRAAAAAAMAIAAALVLFLAMPERPGAPTKAPAVMPVLIASLSSEQSGASLAVAFEPADRTLLVTPGVLRTPPGREHELWIIPAGGKPVSLGIVRPGAPRRRIVPGTLAPLFRDTSVIAVSVEPVRGSITGQPTGPVIATGALTTI